MRQQLIDTQVLGHREHIGLYKACDMLLATSCIFWGLRDISYRDQPTQEPFQRYLS